MHNVSPSMLDEKAQQAGEAVSRYVSVLQSTPGRSAHIAVSLRSSINEVKGLLADEITYKRAELTARPARLVSL